MNYQEFLQKIQGGDSPSARQAYQDMFLEQRAENFGLPPSADSASFLSPVRENTATGEIGMWDLGGGASHGGHGAHEGAVQQTFKDWYKNKEWLNKPTGSGLFSQLPTGRDLYNAPTRNPHEWANAPESLLSESSPYQGPGERGFGYIPASSPVESMPDEFGGLSPSPVESMPDEFGGLSPSTSSSTAGAGFNSGAWTPSSPTPLVDAPYGYPDPTLDTASSAADAGGMTGPQMFAANMALNMIPTRDRKKVSTPLGDKGSFSGITKGAGKGALTGATIGSFFPGPGTAVGAVVGGGVGLLAGTQGYFDSESPPSIAMSRIKRGGGMQGGLLGGGSMYG